MLSHGFATAFLLLALLGSSQAAHAQNVLARASALQPPVWVERDGHRSALRPGAALYAGDRYLTGKGARLQIEMEDASVIKLGENAEFQLPTLQIVDDGGDGGGLLRGALKVVKGAFRFTTSALGALRRRELDVYIGPTITAGIRGTDIWGKSEDPQDLICLLEGKIEVSSPGAPVQTMDQPKTFYVVPRDQPPLPIVPTPEEKLVKWVPQTELDPAEAGQLATGRYRIVLASFGNQAQADREVAVISDKGFAADVLATPVDGKTRYRLVMSGFDSQAEAARFARSLKTRLGLKNPWVLAPG